MGKYIRSYNKTKRSERRKNMHTDNRERGDINGLREVQFRATWDVYLDDNYNNAAYFEGIDDIFRVIRCSRVIDSAGLPSTNTTHRPSLPSVQLQTYCTIHNDLLRSRLKHEMDSIKQESTMLSSCRAIHSTMFMFLSWTGRNLTTQAMVREKKICPRNPTRCDLCYAYSPLAWTGYRKRWRYYSWFPVIYSTKTQHLESTSTKALRPPQRRDISP